MSRFFLAAAISMMGSVWVAGTDLHSSSPCPKNLTEVFGQGQQALQVNDLQKAEESFREVVHCDPKSAAAYVNLAVIEMRRKQWSAARGHLDRAERLAPNMSGIHLDKGLLYFKQGDYRTAIPELSVAARQSPSIQSRYLLGLSYFLTGDYTSARETLSPDWNSQSGNLVYLYVLGIAAEQSGNKSLSDQAFGRLLEIGGDSPGFHLLKAKAYLNRGQPDDAIPELEKAIAKDPKLPFGHFNLGWAYSKKHDYPRARQEFLKDIALEPDVPYSYEQLGAMDLFLGNYAEAQQYYKQALARDPRLPSSLYGLGKSYEHDGQFAKAVGLWRAAEKLSPHSISIHNSLGRLLQRMHKSSDAGQEFAIVTRLEQKEHADEVANPRLPSPELKEQN